MYKSYLLSVGSYLPEKILTNNDLEKLVDTSDEWITKRTGIKERHVVCSELTSDMAAEAARRCIKDRKVDIDAIIVATCTPDKTFPSVASIVQNKLGYKNAFSFDVQAACSGFLYALSTADCFISSNKITNALVIGADSMSKLVNWKDRNTCILFGDGAGAVLLGKTEKKDKRGMIFCNLYCDSDLINTLYTDGGVSQNKHAGTIIMDGSKVFETAIKKLVVTIGRDLDNSGYTINEIDHFIMHQANSRMIKSIAFKLNIPVEKTIITTANHANTSAASIPLALDEVKKNGAIKEGDRILFAAVGAGLTFATCLLKL